MGASFAAVSSSPGSREQAVESDQSEQGWWASGDEAACMRTLLFLLLLALPAAAAPWTSPDGKFTIAFPAEPKATSETDSSPLGDITSHTFTADQGGVTYSVTYSDLPGLAVLFGGSGTIYDNAKGDLLHSAFGKATSWNDQTIAGHPGKALVYDVPEHEGQPDMTGKANLVLVGDRLYVINVTAPAGQGNADAFLNSFTAD